MVLDWSAITSRVANVMLDVKQVIEERRKTGYAFLVSIILVVLVFLVLQFRRK